MTVREVTPEMADRLGMSAGKGVDRSGREAGNRSRKTRPGPRRYHPRSEQTARQQSEEDFVKVEASLKSGQDVVFLVRPRGSRGPRRDHIPGGYTSVTNRNSGETGIPLRFRGP